MASFGVSQLGKFLSLQNNSGSADSAAPLGGVYLFASGTVGSTKLYMQNEGGTITDVTKALDIDAFDALGGAGLHQTQDHFVFSDNGTEKKITFSNLQDAVFADVSGDVAVAAGGAATIQADAVEGSMLNDNVISGQTELAHADIASADELMISDGGTLKKVGLDSLRDHYYGQVSGDATIADGGALTIGANAVQTGMVHDDVATELAGNGLAAASGVMSLDLDELSAAAVDVSADSIAILDASDDGSKKESIADLATAMAGDGLAAASGVFAVQVGSNKGLALTSDALEITGSAVAAADVAVGTDTFMFFDADGSVKEESLSDYATAIAGNGLAASSGVLAVGVDDATIELNSDALRIKDGGVDADALASSVAGNGLAGGGGTALSLDLNELSAAAVAVGADSIAIIDADDNSSKKEAISDLATAMVGDGLAASSGVFAVQVGSNKGLALTSDALEITGSAVAAADVAVGTDTFMFFDADGSVKEESLSDYATAIAGDGLAASSGVLAVGVDDTGIELNSDALRLKDNGVTLAKMAGITRGSMIIGDASGDPSLIAKGTSGQFLQSDGTDPSYVSMSGDVASLASGGAVTMAAAQTNITSILAADLKIGEDDETKIDFETVDEIHFYAANAEQVYVADGVFGPQTDSDVDLGADGVAFKKLFVDDVDLNGAGRIDLDADGDTSIRSAADDQIQFELGGGDRVTMTAAGMAVGAGAGAGGSSLGIDGSGTFDGGLVAGASGTGAGLRAFGAATGEEMIWTAAHANLSFKYHDGSSQATIMTLGGDASSDFAIEVANGSANINKIKAAAFVTYSDESLKSDVTSMGNTALDAVMSLNGVEFTWKDSGERDFGFIAQDVQKVVPKAVHTGGDGVQGVDYSRLTSVLVEAVKAQQVQIEELKTLLKK